MEGDAIRVWIYVPVLILSAGPATLAGGKSRPWQPSQAAGPRLSLSAMAHSGAVGNHGAFHTFEINATRRDCRTRQSQSLFQTGRKANGIERNHQVMAMRHRVQVMHLADSQMLDTLRWWDFGSDMSSN